MEVNDTINHLRDVIGIVDIVLWECYCCVLGCRHFDDSSDGGKRVLIKMNLGSAAQFVQHSGVIA